MSGSAKLILILLAAVFVVYFGLKILAGITGAIMGLISLLVPVLIVAAVGYVLYMIVSRKALGGGRRILP
jgi:hypothetical protein